LAQRTSTTFAKRQKERARQEKQQAKQQRRLQRNLEKQNALPDAQSAQPGSTTVVASSSPLFSEMGNTASEIATNEKEREMQ
jgi:hypothetical protein